MATVGVGDQQSEQLVVNGASGRTGKGKSNMGCSVLPGHARNDDAIFLVRIRGYGGLATLGGVEMG